MSLLRKCAVSSLFVYIVFLCSCAQEDPEPATMQEAVDNIISPHITLGADVGIIVGIIKNGQKTIYSYGEKEIGSKERITAQSVLELASLTKVYTALAVAQMHVKGELNLSDPVDQYLPSSVTVPSYNGKKITLEQLANHTSGLPTYPENMNTEVYNQYKGYTEQNMYDFMNTFVLTREPGTKEEYSNTGYGLLGQILSLKNNSDYETAITKQVLQPLGMIHTTVSFTPDQIKNLVHGHYGNKHVESWSQYMQNIIQGGGALISSMEDQLIFLEANLGLKSTPLDSAILLTHKVTFEHAGKFNSDGMALGWTHYNSNGNEILWKNGGNGGYSTFMGFSKTSKTGVVILVNSSMNPEAYSTFSGFKILIALDKF